MTQHHTSVASFLISWRWVIISTVLLVAFLCSSSMLAVVAFHEAAVARRMAALNAIQVAQNTQTIADLTDPPFVSVKLKSVSVNGGPPITDLQHTLFAYPCDQWKLQRPVVSKKSGQVKIAKAWVGGKNGILPAPEGSETFVAGLNTMQPVVQIPSNAERHQYLEYSTSISMTGSLAAATIMQGIRVYILNPGEKKPAPGVYPPPRDDPPSPPKPGDPYCPVIVNPSPSSSPQ